jgi:hypothetical protein
MTATYSAPGLLNPTVPPGEPPRPSTGMSCRTDIPPPPKPPRPIEYLPSICATIEAASAPLRFGAFFWTSFWIALAAASMPT